MQSGLEASYSQVDFPKDCIACIDETTTGPVIPNGYCLYGGHIRGPLICYQQERVFAHTDVVEEISPEALPICGYS